MPLTIHELIAQTDFGQALPLSNAVAFRVNENDVTGHLVIKRFSTEQERDLARALHLESQQNVYITHFGTRQTINVLSTLAPYSSNPDAFFYGFPYCNNVCAWFAPENGEPVMIGYALAWHNQEKQFSLAYNNVVMAPYRSNGLGTLMRQFAIEEARELGQEYVMVRVHARNPYIGYHAGLGNNATHIIGFETGENNMPVLVLALPLKDEHLHSFPSSVPLQWFRNSGGLDTLLEALPNMLAHTKPNEEAAFTPQPEIWNEVLRISAELTKTHTRDKT